MRTTIILLITMITFSAEAFSQGKFEMLEAVKTYTHSQHRSYGYSGCELSREEMKHFLEVPMNLSSLKRNGGSAKSDLHLAVDIQTVYHPFGCLTNITLEAFAKFPEQKLPYNNNTTPGYFSVWRRGAISMGPKDKFRQHAKDTIRVLGKYLISDIEIANR